MPLAVVLSAAKESLQPPRLVVVISSAVAADWRLAVVLSAAKEPLQPPRLAVVLSAVVLSSVAADWQLRAAG